MFRFCRSAVKTKTRKMPAENPHYGRMKHILDVVCLYFSTVNLRYQQVTKWLFFGKIHAIIL